MALSSTIKYTFNRGLEPFNLRIETCTAERQEMARLQRLESEGHFDRPVFPVLKAFESFNPLPLFAAILNFRQRTKHFAHSTGHNEYKFDNEYFTSPDAEVAYALVRNLKPKQIIEVGSGNSTRLLRAAINDGGLDTILTSIDPSPRISIKSVADRIIAKPVEQVPVAHICGTLGENDILFIDSSHQIQVGNDVVTLILNVLPLLKGNVVIHLHDIFLPFEYPKLWVIERKWRFNEQYIIQVLLQSSTQFEVLWPGHFLQRTLSDFETNFPDQKGTASSLWLRKAK